MEEKDGGVEAGGGLLSTPTATEEAWRNMKCLKGGRGGVTQ